MEAKQCPNGHYYDSEKFTSCPFCKDENNETMPIGGTMPLTTDSFDTVPPTMPFTDETASQQPDSGYPDVELSKTVPIGVTASTAPQSESFGETKAYDEANLGFVPTVGWVICIRGPHKGKDFRLVTGYNKIGRSREMAICLPGDDQITRESHAIIAYEPQSRKFFAAGDKNMIYLNGSFMMGMQELHANDVIKVGASELMFVPLCGELFNWE